MKIQPIAAVGCALLLPTLNAKEPRELESRLRELVGGKPGVYAVAFQDLETGATVAVNARDRMHAASLMKVPVMMAVFEMLDRGETTLDRPVATHNRFRSLVDGSPFSLGPDEQTPLLDDLGREVPLIDLVQAMITRSDNLATNLVMEIAGAERVQDLVRRLGAADTLVRRGVQDLKAFEAGLNNETSAADMVRLLVACRDSPRFTVASRRRMMEILRGQEIRSMLAAGLPAGTGLRLAGKTGSISTARHDAAVVERPDGGAYVAAILIRDFGDRGEEAVRTGVEIAAALHRWASLR